MNHALDSCVKDERVEALNFFRTRKRMKPEVLYMKILCLEG